MYNETPLSDQWDLPRLTKPYGTRNKVCLYIDTKKGNSCIKPRDPDQGRLHSGGVDMSNGEGQDGLVGMLDKLLSMLIEPLAGLGSSRHAAFSVALAPGSNPHDVVDQGIVHCRAGYHSET